MVHCADDRPMVRTLLTGATGTLGRALAPRLADAGHTVRGSSRDPPADDGAVEEWVELTLPNGPGFEAALDGIDVVVHAASDAVGDTEAVDVRGTERLLEAAETAAVSNLVYVSIVGIDEVPFSYYQHKLTAEGAVEAADVPWTIIRLTQFHPFIAELLGLVARLPVWPLPTTWQSQPIDIGEAADAVVEVSTLEASGRVPDVGGPEARTIGELARSYRSARDLRRPIVRLPVPGKTARAFREGRATCPDRAVGTVTWETWLEREYG